MELFEKLNAFAKTAADKTNELVEDTRLKTQILHDEKSIRELEAKIGAYYSEYCTAISVHKANIEEKKAALAKEAKEEAAASEEVSEEAEEISEPEEDPFE